MLDRSDPLDASAALATVLATACRALPEHQRGLLEIVLALDPAQQGLSAVERRRRAAACFRGGSRPVTPGTIRQHHEPRALDELAVVLSVAAHEEADRLRRSLSGTSSGGAELASGATNIDFFVSYTSADRPWAEWIASELDHAGYSAVLQAWDMQPGSNLVVGLDRAAQVADRTVAVMSPALVESPYFTAEWADVFRRDPTGVLRTLLPVRVRACNPDGLLGSIVYVDLVGLSESASRAALLTSVTGGAKRADVPGFPRADTRVKGSGERVRRPEGGAAVFNVPVSTRSFVGRQGALEQLAAGLEGAGTVAVTQLFAIHGLGGVGKTQLAARYARVQRDAYDVIWWLRAEQPATLRADLAGLAATLGLVDDYSDEQAALDAARGWLERSVRWLIVFDNAPGPDAIAEYLPEGDGGHVLITSRAHADWRAVGARPLELDVWRREESRAFLVRRTGEGDPGVLDAIADALGDLPLALEQASSYVNTKAITLSGYLERLGTRAPELLAAGGPAGYEHTVATVWQLAFEAVAERPTACALLQMCAQLAPEQIGRELLDALPQAAGTPAVSDRDVDEAVELLLSYSMLTPSGSNAVAMHRLVGQFTRERATHAARTAAAATAVTILDDLWPARPWQHEQWPVCERLLAHAVAASEHSEHQAAAPTETARLLTRVGLYEWARGEYFAARRLIERALATFEAVYGPEHPDVAMTLGNLGNVQRQLGDFAAALATQERTLRIKQAVYGPEHPEVAMTLGNLGIVQQQLGEFAAALATEQRALAIKEAVYGPEHPEVAITLGNLGIVQQQLGEFAAALATEQRALAIKEAVYGPEHPEVAITLTNLGNVQLQLGESEAARATLQRALAIKEAVYGSEHPEVAITLTNLGNVQLQLGECDAARATQQRALAIKEAIYGPEHPQVAIMLGNLGSVQQQLGEFAAALATEQRALAIKEAVYGPEHPEVAITLTNLGNVQLQLGESEAARATLQRALAIKEAVYGSEHPEVAITLTNLGNVQLQLGESEAARATQHRALAIYGSEHPEVAITISDLRSVGNVQLQLGVLGRKPESGGTRLSPASPARELEVARDPAAAALAQPVEGRDGAW